MTPRFAQITAVAMALGLAAGCLTSLPTAKDPTAVAHRYAFRHDGTCSSWLVSHRTGYQYCASPKVDLPLQGDVVEPSGTAEEVDESTLPTDKDSLVAAGETVYGNVCAACHQAEGQGLAPTFPPLAGSGEFYGDAQNMARIIVHGLNGPITVQGVDYNGAMPPQGAALSDYKIAAVATYVRNSWGNDDGVVLPSDVAAVR